VKIKKAYKFRLKINESSQQKLERFSGCCRFVWNKVLALNLDRLQNKQSIIWYHEADYWSKLWKASNEYGFLAEAPAQCLQQKLRDLDKAFRDAFNKNQPLKRLPKFKKRGLHSSIRFPTPIQLENRRVRIPKLGWIGFYKSQDIEGEIKNATLSRQGDQWYIAIQVEQDIEQYALPEKSVGIDLGIKRFAALSDGTYINPINTFKKEQKYLAKAQKKLRLKKKFSLNWKKQQVCIRKIHNKIKNRRLDFLHKNSTRICKNHATIVVEALKISNMTRSASGSKEVPGRNVRAKSGLNKSILDQGWFEFKRQLEYKTHWLGGALIKVNPKNTSLKCNVCGHTAKENRENQAQFFCIVCRHRENADTNAAKNILAAGQSHSATEWYAVLACRENGLPISVKQEPLGISNLVPA